MKGQVLLAVLALLVLIPSARGSQQPDDPNDLQTLADYLRYAALNNAGLKAEFEHWKAAIEQVPQARALPDPRFTYGYFIEEVETRVGPQRNKFGISQMFPWFGKIQARTRAAGASAQAARRRYEGKKLKLFFEVKEGLDEDEIVVTKGNFKIDSALQIQAKPSMMSAESEHEVLDVADEFSGQIWAMVEKYMLVQKALAGDDKNAATEATSQVLDALSRVDMGLFIGEVKEVIDDNTK